MKAQNLTIEQLAEKFGTTVWTKGELKRIYLNDEGYNTKKMSTKTFIYEKDGEFKVSCKIECPSQPYQWIESQEDEVKKGVYSDIEKALFEINNPEIDYFEFKEKEELKREQRKTEIETEHINQQKELNNKEERLLTALYLRGRKRREDYYFETLEDYFFKSAYSTNGLFIGMPIDRKNGIGIEKYKVVEQIEVAIKPLDYYGGYNESEIINITLPVIKSHSSNKYHYYKIDETNLCSLLPESIKAKWIEAKEKTFRFNCLLQAEIEKHLGEDKIEVAYNLDRSKMYTAKNDKILAGIKSKIDSL